MCILHVLLWQHERFLGKFIKHNELEKVYWLHMHVMIFDILSISTILQSIQTRINIIDFSNL